jgi:hypothetical protein
MAKTRKASRKESRKEDVLSPIDAEIHRIESEIERFKKGVESLSSAKPEETVISANLIEKEIKAIEKESKGKWGPVVFYFISSLVCTGILAWLFGSLTGFVVYFSLGMLLWWWSHQFHLAKARLLRSFVSIGSFMIVLYVSYVIFNDLLGLIVCILYAIAFVIAGILYLYHFKREMDSEVHRSFPRTFLVVFYSHVIAFTSAVVVAYLLPEFIFGDGFVSVIFLLLAWVLPSVLVYFFLTKFLYLRFFDRVHVKRDILKALGHGIAHAVLLIALLALAYLLTAMQLVWDERDSYSASYTSTVMSLSNTRSEISAGSGEGIFGLKVAQDVVSLSESVLRNASSVRGSLKISFSLYEYITDAYFSGLVRNRLAVRSIEQDADGVVGLKSDLEREYRRMSLFAERGYYDDGTTTMSDHSSSLDDFVSVYYIPFAEPGEFSIVKSRFSAGSYSASMADREIAGMLYAYSDEFDFLDARSEFASSLLEVLYHTLIFRQVSWFAFSGIADDVHETIDPSMLRALYDMRAGESEESRVLRFRMIRSDKESLLALSE